MPKLIAGPLVPISLEIENVKRLSAFSVTFGKDNLVQIVGENGEGKTSALDSLWWALEGADHIQAEPIKKGADRARIRLDLGECVITRTFKALDDNPKKKYTTGLTVTTAEGAKWDSPQMVVDDLLGALSMDPIEFMAQKPEDQFATLSRFVPGFDFDAFAEAQQADYDMRTEAGRILKREQAAADSVMVPAGTPDAKADEEALADEIEAAAAHNATLEKRTERREAVAAEMEALNVTIEKAQARLSELQALQMSAEPLPEPIDVEKLRIEHRAIREANVYVERKHAKARHLEAAAAAKQRVDDLTEKMEAREAAKKDAIAAAEMPVPGIEFGEAEIRLNGEPFNQASDAEQLRISMAVAMKLKPKLRVLRVRQGDRLDGKSMRLVEDMARDEGFLVIMERVLPSPGVGMVVEIVDGKVKNITKGARQ